jgi:polyhydroxyalkanoate synthesis repressor PhaR
MRILSLRRSHARGFFRLCVMAKPPTLVKKYGNRRLYDTSESRYVTLEELEQRIRGGEDVRVLDAKSDADLTQSTLAQIILESRGGARLLPVPLLLQLIRMGDDALAEFFGRYMGSALEMYVQAQRGAQAISPYVPMATLPFAATNALARLLLGAGQMIAPEPQWVPTPGMAAAPPPAPPHDDENLAALRRELDELRQELRAKKTSKPRA